MSAFEFTADELAKITKLIEDHEHKVKPYYPSMSGRAENEITTWNAAMRGSLITNIEAVINEGWEQDNENIQEKR